MALSIHQTGKPWFQGKIQKQENIPSINFLVWPFICVPYCHFYVSVCLSVCHRGGSRGWGSFGGAWHLLSYRRQKIFVGSEEIFWVASIYLRLRFSQHHKLESSLIKNVPLRQSTMADFVQRHWHPLLIHDSQCCIIYTVISWLPSLIIYCALCNPHHHNVHFQT